MTEERASSTRATRGRKQDEISKIADHVLVFYELLSGPKVLMWRELMNSYNQAITPGCLVWNQDQKCVHEHYKRYGPGVIKILQKRGLTIVRVNRLIRDLVGHGKTPVRSGRKTDEAYRQCLPSATHMTMGIVSFPRDTQQDHPLIVESRSRRTGRDVTSLTAGVNSVRDANDLGTISNEVSGKIIDDARVRTHDMFAHERYPLFKESAALPPGE